MTDEGTLDPYVAEWLDANPMIKNPIEDFPPELRELARGDFGAPPTRAIASVEDSDVDGIPIRIYRGEEPPAGTVVYFHGGGHVIGSIGLMDNVARELAHATGAIVVSVGYRLAPEDPYPAGFDDCVAVTRWAERFDLPIVVCGESAGGNLAAAVALKLRDALAGQVLIYPATAGGREQPSWREFDGIVLSLKSRDFYWTSYCGGQHLDDDPFAAPLSATDLRGLPPALVILGGSDMLRDEGRAYATRMRDEGGVDVEEICYPGQPHGFVNFGLPAAELAFTRIGEWVRARL